MTVSEQIIQVLNDLCEKFGLAIDWTGTNVLPYFSTLCEKLVTYKIWTSVAWIVLATVLSIAGCVFLKVCWKAIKESLYDGGPIGIFSICAAVGGYPMAIICIFSSCLDIVKCVTFPEMFVIEYLTMLINRAS